MKSILLTASAVLENMLPCIFTTSDIRSWPLTVRRNASTPVLPYVTEAQIGDSTNESFLSSLGIRNFDACIVAIGDNFQSSLETTSLLKELGAKLVVSRASSDVHQKFLLRNGADQVVYPEQQLAKWTAIRFSSNHILDFCQSGRRLRYL